MKNTWQHMQSPVEKDNLYEKLSECIVNAKGDNIIVLGNFNARVGKDWKSWPSVIGKYGVGKMNSNGLMLLEFCTRFQLSVMGTTVCSDSRITSRTPGNICNQNTGAK
jgi:hypothetical protein